MKTRVAILTATLAVVQFLSSYECNAASERSELLGSSTHSGRALSGDRASGIINISPNVKGGELSPFAMKFAEKLGLLPKFERLQSLRSQSSPDSVSSVELLSLRQELLESVVISAEELRTVVARVSSEIADTSEIHAHLSERRDKAVRINTYANLISGGVTGMVGGGLQLADVNHLSPDLIDTTEGVIQTALAGWALSQQRGEKRLVGGTPSLLNHMMNRSPELENDFPPSVWAYYSLPLRGGKETIMSSLVDRWFRLNLCLKHGGHRESRASRQVRISNSPNTARVTIDILEDRMAILSDLRACTQQMDYLVLELMQCVHGTKSLPSLRPAP